MDLDFVAAFPGSRWMAESAVRRRQQRRLSSPSLRAHLTPAFDAVAAGADGMSAYSGSASSSSGGLDLGFDDSLLRYRRACFSATADLGPRVFVYSPQSGPVYQVSTGGDVGAAGGCRYDSKRQAAGQTGAPGFQDFNDIDSLISPWQPCADDTTATARGICNKTLAVPRPREDTVVQATKAEPSTPKPEVTTLSAQPASAQAEPFEEDEELILKTLYGQSNRRRLPVFISICPE
ncbi:uncharacterized protein LOC102720617 [Oryza brachyantha]|uniref:uncharacterized protein LOC102720617 n=1 Tax=Oryza brachyantha TaxID=4533 RepID=UPI0003EAAF6A|nr:uncharacterized protein LOC102720617 [Oryza brachyantha]